MPKLETPPLWVDYFYTRSGRKITVFGHRPLDEIIADFAAAVSFLGEQEATKKNPPPKAVSQSTQDEWY